MISKRTYTMTVGDVLANLEALADAYEAINSGASLTGNYQFLVDSASAAATLRASQQLISELPEWISVYERLPPTDEPVLACWSRQKIGMGCAMIRNLAGKYCWTPADQWDECDEPIAWMPLPEPPEFP